MALSNESGNVSASKDDLASCDEVKVYQDEGDGEQRSSENLSEEKLGLVNETEESPTNAKSDREEFLTVKTESFERNGIFPYFPAFYPNGQFGSHPAFERFAPVNTFGLNLPGIMFYPGQEGCPRFPLTATSPICSMYQDFTQWRPNSFFPMHPGTFRDTLISPLGFPMNRFAAPYMHPHPGFSPFSPYFTPKSENVANVFSSQYYKPTELQKTEEKPKKPRIKKPLNAFMLFMKEQRRNVVSECTLKESAAINQILGRKWHELQHEDQAKYFEMARQERIKHMEMYPGWSARDNYGLRKKRRKKREKLIGENGELARKCRARYGLDQINMWCKPCRRKKKCIRFTGSDDNASPGTECTDTAEPENRIDPGTNSLLNEVVSTVVNQSPKNSEDDLATVTKTST